MADTKQRPTMEQIFMSVAELVALRGTCARAKVGAVLVRDERIISIGYNGAPPGQKHCIEVGCEIIKDNCARATHAEQNAILFAAKAGISTNKAILYCLYAPCRACAHSIIAAGIEAVWYKWDYHDAGLDILHDSHIIAKRWGQASL